MNAVDTSLAHYRAHCSDHWQLHTALAADSDKAGTALSAVLVSSCRGFYLACNRLTCSGASCPTQCLLFLVSAVPVLPAASSVRKRQHAMMNLYCFTTTSVPPADEKDVLHTILSYHTRKRLFCLLSGLLSCRCWA